MILPAWSQVRKKGDAPSGVQHDDRVRLVLGEKLERRRLRSCYRVVIGCHSLRRLGHGSRIDGQASALASKQLSRQRPLSIRCAPALLIVDVQNATFNDAQENIRPEFFAAARDIVIPNLARLIAACRAAASRSSTP